MGLFSIFSSRKNAEGERSRGAAGSAADVARDAVHESRTSSRASSNSRSRASRRVDDDDDGLDPELPQKQRARRRLIGAVVLVGAAVVVLPLVFDAKPRPVTDAVAVQIQDQPIDRGAKASTDEPKVASRRSAPRAPGSSADQPQALDQGEEVVAYLQQLHLALTRLSSLRQTEIRRQITTNLRRILGILHTHCR